MLRCKDEFNMQGTHMICEMILMVLEQNLPFL